MANINEIGNKLDANTAKADKAFGEIRSALDKALETQVTPAELDKAIADAKASQKLEDEAAFDAALAPLVEKVNAQEATMQKLDDIVPDVVEPTEPAEPVEPGTGGGNPSPNTPE